MICFFMLLNLSHQIRYFLLKKCLCLTVLIAFVTVHLFILVSFGLQVALQIFNQILHFTNLVGLVVILFHNLLDLLFPLIDIFLQIMLFFIILLLVTRHLDVTIVLLLL